MNRCSARRPSTRRLFVEPLEARRVLAAPACVDPTCLEIGLDEELDRFGRQIATVQAYGDPPEARATLAIYDTGASVVSFSAVDQLLLELLGDPIPVKVPGGATADAIGGTLTGDVSQPAEIAVDGLHALQFGSDLNLNLDLSRAVGVPGVQAFIGTEAGSPLLPSLTGTPIHNPSPSHPQGTAAQVDFSGYSLDLGSLFPELPEFQGIVVTLPNLHFLDPGTQLAVAADGLATEPVRVPLGWLGTSNHQDPGDMVTSSPVPVQTSVSLYEDLSEQHDQTLLFDTGAQLTVISDALARSLGLDPAQPERTIEVAGAGGSLLLPGFTLDVIDLPRDDDNDGTPDGTLRFRDAPVYVLDTLPGLDGILGTNLLNTTSQMLFDPFDASGPSVQLSFLASGARTAPDPQAVAGLNLLAASYPVFAGAVPGQAAPGFRFDPGPGWQNPIDRFDVDNDSVVAPADVLRLFNLLNSRGAHTLPEPPVRETNEFLFFDVNGDGQAAPSDPLLVINRLNSNPSSGAEGEAPAVEAVFAAHDPELAASELAGGGSDSPVERARSAARRIPIGSEFAPDTVRRTPPAHDVQPDAPGPWRGADHLFESWRELELDRFRQIESGIFAAAEL